MVDWSPKCATIWVRHLATHQIMKYVSPKLMACQSSNYIWGNQEHHHQNLRWLVHYIFCNPRNLIQVKHKINCYWTILEMIKNVPKRHVNIENLKCFMTMNSFQVLIMLRKFNIKAFILEIITVTKCFAWFSSLQNVLNNIIIITINSRWSLWTKNNSSNSSFSWYLQTKNNNKSNSSFFGKDIISNTTSIINKNNRIKTYSKMSITFNMNFLHKTKKLEINK
jgi:hypothetical protein